MSTGMDERKADMSCRGNLELRDNMRPQSSFPVVPISRGWYCRVIK